MPYTLAHMAAALPFRRFCPHRLDLPALLIGTVVPDIGYFVGIMSLSDATHAASLAVPSCLAIGWLMYVVWCVLRQQVAELLPSQHRLVWTQHAATVADTSFVKRLLRVSASLLIGSATHLFLDALTHRSGVFVEVIDVLREPWITHPPFRLSGYYVMQWLLSLIGMWVLLRWYRTAVRNVALTQVEDTNDRWPPQTRLWITAVIVAAVAAMLWSVSDFGRNMNTIGTSRAANEVAFRLMTWPVSAMIAATIVCAVGWSLWRFIGARVRSSPRKTARKPAYSLGRSPIARANEARLRVYEED